MDLRKLIALAAALVVMPVSAQFRPTPAQLSTIEVRDDIFVIFNEGVPGNVTVLNTDDGLLLVDNKFPIDYDNLMAELRKVTDKPIKYVVNSHYHNDHSGNNAVMQAHGAKVISAENARIKMIDTQHPGLPDVTLDSHLRVHLGGVSVDVYYFGRAHTDGDVVVHFPDHGVLASGDTYTHGPGLAQLIDYPGGGSARAWPATLTKALMLDFDTVIPGHGTVATYADLEAFRDATQKLVDTVSQMQRGKRDVSDIEAMLRAEYGFEDFHLQMSLPGILVELQ